MRIFKKITSVDFGAKKLAGEEATKFNEELKMNTYIQSVIIKKKAIDSRA